MERIAINVTPNLDGEIPSEEALVEAMKNAGWTDDPRDGRTIILEDGREVLNPLPCAPPIGYVESPSIMELIAQQIRAHNLLIAGNDEVDSLEDAEDFDVDDEFDHSSEYEITMKEEFPGIPSDSQADPLPVPPPDGAATLV